MIYGLSRVVTIAMTLSVGEGLSSIKSLFEQDVSYICAPVDKILNDKECRAEPLQ